MSDEEIILMFNSLESNQVINQTINETINELTYDKQNELTNTNNIVNDLHIISLTNIRFSSGFTI